MVTDHRSRWKPAPPGLLAHKGRQALLAVLRQFLGHPEQRLSAIHFGPDLGRGDPELALQNGEIIDQVDAFLDHGGAPTAYRFDDHLGRFFGNLLCHPRQA
jgi:hypothetical protein